MRTRNFMQSGAWAEQFRRACLGFSLMCALGTTFVSLASAQDSPLERLQQRSADSRWKDAKQEWFPTGEISTPRAVPEQTPSVSSPLSKVEGETPTLKTDRFDSNTPFFVPLPLFDLLPQELESAAPSGELPQPRISSAKPFPSDTTTVPAEPSRSMLVPNPYLNSAGLTSLPSVPTTLPTENVRSKVTQKVEAPALLDEGQRNQSNLTEGGALRGHRYAQVTPVPPAPASATRNRLPELRKITDIRPFHDYVPAQDTQVAGSPKPAITSGPTYEDLPLSGELTREAAPTYHHWLASDLTHDPLYFEDVALERSGHTYPFAVQPFISISKFGLQVIGWPYQMALNPVDCEQYALGYYRPGDCAPGLRYRIPFNKKAAVTSAGVYTGLIFLIP